MKCKKCFKIIPPGEEIIHNPCGGKYSDSSGGGYCEPCYKKYIFDSGIGWVGILIIVLAITALLGIFIYGLVNRKENDKD